jgi:hypothetical protein
VASADTDVAIPGPLGSATARRTPPPLVGLSLMPEPAFAAATVPLFAEGLVDVVEWSFDMGWGPSGLPQWLAEVLDEFAAEGRLDGHGVSFSLLSRHERQDAWLAHLERELRRRPYRRVSEHLGFMAAGDVRRSTPLPLPFHPDVVGLGRAQLRRLRAAAGMPVGLENLATVLCRADALDHGALLETLTAGDDWIVLDVHNLFCHAVNFDLDPGALLDSYPCDRVREVHASGGSWWTAPGSGRRVRRDTHDGPVPGALFELLPAVLDRCPNADTVVLERLGWTLDDPDEAMDFRNGFLALRTRCGAPV